MARRHPATRREKLLITITAIVVLGTGAYFGFLDAFFTKYGSVSDELQMAVKQLDRQRETLARGPKVDAEFRAIEGSLSTPRPGKSPDMAFTEDMEILFQTLRLATPEFKRDKVEEVPKTAGFSYLSLTIEHVRTDLRGLSFLLKSFSERHLLLRKLIIRSMGSAQSGESGPLETLAEVAQVIRTEEMPESRRPARAAAPVKSAEEKE